MSSQKTATLNLRITPPVKEALRVAAERQHRSVANLVEVLIIEHCHRNAIAIPRSPDGSEGIGNE